MRPKRKQAATATSYVAPTRREGKRQAVTPVRRTRASATRHNLPPTVDAAVDARDSSESKYSSLGCYSQARRIFARATVDAAFKHLFGTDDMGLLCSFLSAITGVFIGSVSPHPLSLPVLKESESGKQSFLDLACQDNLGTCYLVEVQVKEQYFWDRRALYYASGVYSRQLEQGDHWNSLTPVIAVNVLDHDRQTLPDGKFKRHFCMIDLENPSQSQATELLDVRNESSGDIRRGLHLIQIELPRVDLRSLPNTPLRQWLQLFKESQNFYDIPPEVTDSAVKSAYERLRLERWGDRLKQDYEAQELHLEDYAGALGRTHAEGRAEGRADALLKIVEGLRARGAPLTEISSIVQYSIPEVERLLSSSSTMGRVTSAASGSAGTAF